jgi:hypothetical protein
MASTFSGEKSRLSLASPSAAIGGGTKPARLRDVAQGKLSGRIYV